jgi:hypothetical protein
METEDIRKKTYAKHRELEEVWKRFNDLRNDCLRNGFTDELIDEMKCVIGDGCFLMWEIDGLNSALGANL